MFAHPEPILQHLHPCFSRQTTFEWFVSGLTSIVRWLFLTPESGELILHFFWATS